LKIGTVIDAAIREVHVAFWLVAFCALLFAFAYRSNGRAAFQWRMLFGALGVWFIGLAISPIADVYSYSRNETRDEATQFKSAGFVVQGLLAISFAITAWLLIKGKGLRLNLLTIALPALAMNLLIAFLSGCVLAGACT
jgi:hypothetical protein